MKSKIIENRYILECSCSSFEHNLVFDYDKEFEFVSVGFIYDKDQSFFRRVIGALLYIFKKNGLYFHEVIIHTEDIEQLEELVALIKKERFTKEIKQ